MKAPSIVFFLSSEWSRYHRPGLLRAVAQASDQPVLVVDNPVCLSTARWQRPERWRQWVKQRSTASRLEPIGDRLLRLDASVLLHDRFASGLPGVRELNRRMLAGQVGHALGHLGLPRSPVSWFQFPTQQHYPGLLAEPLAVYECYDEHADLPGRSTAARRHLSALERKLMARCGLVFTTSRPLFEARRAQHPNVVLTYNAADTLLFAPVADDALRRVDARRAAPPTIGYLGTVHEHTDLELLAQIVEQQPSWRLIMIGPVQAGAAAGPLARLRAAANVELRGWVEEAHLAALMKQIDVGVIPYRTGSRFNHFVNPNKLHEYTAMGKPVVASPGLDFSSHPQSVWLADGADAFVAAIGAAHAANSSQAIGQRLELARGHSWPVRAAQMLGCIERSLGAGHRNVSRTDVALAAPTAAP